MLEMDGLTEIEDPDLAIDSAQLHLDAVREPALSLYRVLDAAHNETAHIAVATALRSTRKSTHKDITPLDRRQENRRPPTIGVEPARAYGDDVNRSARSAHDGEPA